MLSSVDLDWFLTEWIYQSSIPDYHLDYKIETKPGKFVLKGTLWTPSKEKAALQEFGLSLV